MTAPLKPVSVILIGIGGYGVRYLEEMQKLEADGKAFILAIIDPFAENSPNWPKLNAKGVRRFDHIEACIEAGYIADLAAIVSPIAFHADQACAALSAGMNVLCEKPICATTFDAQRMVDARDRSGKFLEIGFQWSFSQVIQSLKSDALMGDFGTPKCFTTCVAWPRGEAYYSRNDWAGCIVDRSGRIVYDSPANNANAHYLHNMLFVAGPSKELSAHPTMIDAECYRANPIENFDTACCRIQTQEGIELMFFTTHCVDSSIGPKFSFVFENAVIEMANDSIVARFSDNSLRNYGTPDIDLMFKLRYSVERCRKPASYSTICGAEAAVSHTACIEGMQSVQINTFPEEMIAYSNADPNNRVTYVPTLADAINEGYRQRSLFSELGLPWAARAHHVEIPVVPTGYSHQA